MLFMRSSLGDTTGTVSMVLATAINSSAENVSLVITPLVSGAATTRLNDAPRSSRRTRAPARCRPRRRSAGRPLLDDPAVVHEHDAVGRGARERELVAHDHQSSSRTRGARASPGERHPRAQGRARSSARRRGRCSARARARVQSRPAAAGRRRARSGRRTPSPPGPRASAARPFASASARLSPCTFRSASVTLPSAFMCG